jgi:hypothetical protein
LQKSKMVPQPSNRFGSKRLCWRDYPLKLRRFGLTSGDRMKMLKIKQQIKVIMFAIAQHEDDDAADDDTEDDDDLRRMLFFLLSKLRRITRPNIPVVT